MRGEGEEAGVKAEGGHSYTSFLGGGEDLEGGWVDSERQGKLLSEAGSGLLRARMKIKLRQYMKASSLRPQSLRLHLVFTSAAHKLTPKLTHLPGGALGECRLQEARVQGETQPVATGTSGKMKSSSDRRTVLVTQIMQLPVPKVLWYLSSCSAGGGC